MQGWVSLPGETGGRELHSPALADTKDMGGPVWSAVCPALNRQSEAGVDGTGKSGWEQRGHGQWFWVISNREMKLFIRVS